jgi:hypothetical protein
VSDRLLRVYFDPAEIGLDGYPYAWHKELLWPADGVITPAIKDLIREQAGQRCVRCGHPYRSGQHGSGEWSPCDEQCEHTGPTRALAVAHGHTLVEAQWRILTVHHLNGLKHDCRWWNLVALCQKCHLSVQGRVHMAQVYPHPHSEWFRPYAAAYYAWTYLDEELTREETMGRLDELLALELDPAYRE